MPRKEEVAQRIRLQNKSAEPFSRLNYKDAEAGDCDGGCACGDGGCGGGDGGCDGCSTGGSCDCGVRKSEKPQVK